MFLTRGFLYEEAGTPTGGAGAAAPSAQAPAAPQAPVASGEAAPNAPAQSIVERVAARKAAQAGGQTPAQPGTPPAATQTPAEGAATETEAPPEPPKKSLPKVQNPKPTSLQERIRAKAAAEAERARLVSQQSEVQQELLRLREQLDLSTAQSNKFRKAFDEGDFDGALKSLGIQGGTGEFTKRLIEQKTGKPIPQEDQRLTELQNELKTLREREEAREAERQQREQETALQKQYNDDLAQLVTDAKNSGFEEIEKAAEVPGFVKLVYGRMQQQWPQIESGALTMDEVWAQSHADYQEWFSGMYLSGAFKIPDRGSNHAQPPDLARVQPAITSPDRPRVADERKQRPAASHISPAGVSEPVARVVPRGAEFEEEFRRRKEAVSSRAFRKS